MSQFTIGFYSMFNRGQYDMEAPLFEPFDVEVLIADEKSEQEFIDMLDRLDILIVANNNVTPKHISMMQKCRLIARQGVGLDNIALKAAADAGIMVCNVPGGSLEEVGDHSIALFTALARNLFAYNQHVKIDRIWDHQSMPPVKKMKYMNLFLVGFGKIGRHVAQKAKPLFGDITIYDPFTSDDVIKKAGVNRADQLATGLKNADLVSLHLPFSEDSKHIINMNTLKMMKPEAFLVNMARGSHVNSDDLNAALNNNIIAGAALDVLENELDAEKGDFSHPIYSNPKVVLTPHVGWYGVASRRQARVVAAEVAVDYMAGRPPRNQVTYKDNVSYLAHI